MEKSYSDFAKELGVSKQKLNYYVNDENKEKIFIKKGNKNYVTEFGQEYLYKKTKDKNEKKESEKKEKNFNFYDLITLCMQIILLHTIKGVSHKTHQRFKIPKIHISIDFKCHSC